jgi:hypothetical protein
MKLIRHTRYADRIMRIEGALAVSGVGGGILLWAEASHFGGYCFGAAAFLGLGGINIGVKSLRNYNRYLRGIEGEDSVLNSVQELPDEYACISNFVVPGTRQGDADLLIIGPFGVLVVEVKSYTGHYACHGDTWFRISTRGERLPMRASVSRQLKRNQKAVQHYLIDCDTSAPVHCVAIFNPGVHLDIAHPTVPIIQRPELIGYILGLPTANAPIRTGDLEGLFSPTYRPLKK